MLLNRTWLQHVIWVSAHFTTPFKAAEYFFIPDKVVIWISASVVFIHDAITNAGFLHLDHYNQNVILSGLRETISMVSKRYLNPQSDNQSSLFRSFFFLYWTLLVEKQILWGQIEGPQYRFYKMYVMGLSPQQSNQLETSTQGFL